MRISLRLCMVVPALLWFFGCSVLVSNNPDDVADRLEVLLQQSGTDHESQVVLIEQLIQNLRSSGQHDQVRSLLTTLIASQPDNPYNAYYVTLIAENLRQSGNIGSALLYYYRAAYRYPDVEILGSSVHYRALQALIRHTSNPAKRIQHYQAMQSRFAGRIDPGLHHYKMAKAYEHIGRYEDAFEEYRRFIAYPDTRIPGQPNAYEDVRQLLAFNDSTRNWTRESLDELVSDIRSALASRNPHRLMRNRAQVNFFAMSWKQDTADQNTGADFDFGAFLSRNRVRFSAELEPQSNSREAYLWTSGWEARIPTWYLYFRKIDFPADPHIHGNWEWAGIFFGEQL